MMSRRAFQAGAGLLATLACAGALQAETYTCGTQAGAHPLLSETRYSIGGAGFDLAPSPEIRNGSCIGTGSFFISFALLPGNYVVTVDLGGPQQSSTTVKAEARRLMLLNVATAPGRHTVQQFAVNTRTTDLPDGRKVQIKPREAGSLRWDSKLTLEFAGTNPSVRSIQIAPAPAIPAVYLAGDSTVVDQDKEPWAAWGQVLPLFLDSGVAVANHAESGETIASSTSALRFEKIFSTLRAGDYLFLQFGHNDQKPGSDYVPAATTYSELTRKYIALARKRGATPVLVTSMNRRTFDENGHIRDTLAPYPQTVRSLAEETRTALLDLNACSRQLYEGLGPANSRELFVYAPANTYPDQPEALHDDTHFNAFGAYELARCVVTEIRTAGLPLARHLRRDVAAFDPAHPDSPAAVSIPPSPTVDTNTPYGR